jgi:hypothetical protein
MGLLLPYRCPGCGRRFYLFPGAEIEIVRRVLMDARCASPFSQLFPPVRKEPLAALLERVRAAFLAAEQGEPAIRFSFSDACSPVGDGRKLSRAATITR